MFERQVILDEEQEEKKGYIYCILVSYLQSLYIFFSIEQFDLFAENKKQAGNNRGNKIRKKERLLIYIEHCHKINFRIT